MKCLDIKGLEFFNKENLSSLLLFFTQKKDSGGASIHRIDELFPLEPSLITYSSLPETKVPLNHFL